MMAVIAENQAAAAAKEKEEVEDVAQTSAEAVGAAKGDAHRSDSSSDEVRKFISGFFFLNPVEIGRDHLANYQFGKIVSMYSHLLYLSESFVLKSVPMIKGLIDKRQNERVHVCAQRRS